MMLIYLIVFGLRHSLLLFMCEIEATHQLLLLQHCIKHGVGTNQVLEISGFLDAQRTKDERKKLDSKKGNASFLVTER